MQYLLTKEALAWSTKAFRDCPGPPEPKMWPLNLFYFSEAPMKRNVAWQNECAQRNYLMSHSLTSLSFPQQMYQEVVDTWTLRHPHIINLIGITHVCGPFSLVFPWMPHGTVHNCINELRKQGSLNEPLVNMCNNWVGIRACNS